MQTVLNTQQLFQINDFMSNSLEFYTEWEAMEVFTKEYLIDENTAKKILSYGDQFRTNPFFEITISDINN